jgi:hypothetical protein
MIPASHGSPQQQLLQQQPQQQQQQRCSEPKIPSEPVQPSEPLQPPTQEVVLPPPEAEQPKKLLFVEDLTETIYSALKPRELEKIIQCRYCPRQFKFLSEHLSHLKRHTTDVESVVEMSMKIWVPDRKIKCNECKFKTSYTLDYARHKDTHVINGLACSICQCEVSTPQAYGEHMEIHHPSLVFSEPEGHVEPSSQAVMSTPVPDIDQTPVQDHPVQLQGASAPYQEDVPHHHHQPPEQQSPTAFQASHSPFKPDQAGSAGPVAFHHSTTTTTTTTSTTDVFHQGERIARVFMIYTLPVAI